MRASVLLSIASIVLASAKPIYHTSHDLICNPLDKSDCYPKVLVPTTEWQNIREGQSIPPGLHVRLNMETLVKEAKIMDDSDEEPNELVVVAQPETIEVSEPKATAPSQKNKVATEDLNDFLSAIAEVGDFDDKVRLLKALDVLEDLSHDIEFGAKLTTLEALTSLNNLLEKSNDEGVNEVVYRILSSSLRNNPEAIDNYLTHTPRQDILNLFSKINKSTLSLIKKRILGIILALNLNDLFHSIYFTNYGLAYLVDQYPHLEEENRIRLINIFEDVNLIGSDAKRSESPDNLMSEFLQTSLSGGKLSPAEVESYFNTLVGLHTEDKSLQPSSDFLEWLAEQVENRKELRKRGGEDLEFDRDMLRARHEVFGNRNGLRKAWADEL